MKEFHKCVGALITILLACLQLVFSNTSELGRCILMIFVIVVSAYLGSLGVMILQTDPEFGEFMNKISILFGCLAVTLELLILLQPFGWLVLFVWSICFVMIVTRSYQYLKTLCETAVDQLKQLFSCGGPLREHEAQDQNQNQIINALPV